MKIALVFTLCALLIATVSAVPYPVAVFHGMGDQCSNSGMRKIVKAIAESLNNT